MAQKPRCNISKKFVNHMTEELQNVYMSKGTDYETNGYQK